MKIRLMKCQICADWYSPLRYHCPNCGATRITTLKGTIHVDAANEYKPGILMGSSYTHLTWTSSLSEIATAFSR